MSLKELSDKATPGKWNADPQMLVIKTRSGYTEGPIMSYLSGDANSPEGMKVSIASERHADHYLVAALVNAYRDRLLVERAEVESLWIPMKDRQPEDFQAVLCVNSNGWMTVANRFHQAHVGWNGSHVSAEDTDSPCVIGGITHWQELPHGPHSP